MNTRARNMIMLLVGTILLPLVIYIIYEVSALRENEKVIEQIYKDQLDAIIFSINQYSDDVINSIIDKIDGNFNGRDTLSEKMEHILFYNGIKCLILYPLDSGHQRPLYTTELKMDGLISYIDMINEENRPIIDRLLKYRESGYRKVEPMFVITLHDYKLQLFYSIVHSENEKNYLLAGLIEPHEYINEVLSPKLQQIGDEELIILFQEEKDDKIIFSTDSLVNDVVLYQKMWLFPQLNVGISSKTATVSDLVRQRLKSNLTAAGLLLLLLVVGFTLIVRNLNREIRLAQNKSDFVSNVSHELRTPLALISMFAETLMLGRVKNESKKQEYFEIIYKETARLTNMVNRILNFSRIEANKRNYHFIKFEVRELLHEIIKDYSYHLDQNGFDYRMQLPDLEMILTADREAVYEAVVNLIDNAIKYSKENKQLNIKLSESQGHINIAVEDRGIGIPSEKIDEIFDKFYRITLGDVYTVKGTGLGLSIVSHIMDAHQGRIEVDSQIGKGSTFKLIFKKQPEA